MKAILRVYDNDHYVVKDINFTSDGLLECEGQTVNESNVFTIIGDCKANFARCSSCGEIVINTPKAIEAHRTAHNHYEGCYNCKSLRIEGVKDDKNKTKYTLNDDNTFSRKVNDKVALKCAYSYWTAIDILSDDRMKRCKYSRCKDANIEEIKTFFNKYPNAFDDMITVDAIKNFKDIHKYNDYTRLKLKCRGNIFAVANNKGIISSFIIASQNGTFDVYYSKKYNKLFYNQSGTYREMDQPYGMSYERWAYIKETIAKLYN